MTEKKSLFDLLDAKSAFIVGIVGGLLALGTLSLIAIGILVFNGTLSISVNVKPSAAAAVANQNLAGAQPTPTVQAPTPVVPKTAKPKVELFVMAYCPYGLQMEKAYIPAWNLLKDKADISVKFVSYAMHGKKEVDENTRQYCIENEQGAKYTAYLQCFTASGDSASCLSQNGVNESALNSCVGRIDKQFGITAKYNDQSSWLSGRYPLYPIHDDLNKKYGVQGSPTLVINGSIVEVSRTPEAVKNAICAGFTNPPAECGQKLSSDSFGSGFGSNLQANAGGQAGCGT